MLLFLMIKLMKRIDPGLSIAIVISLTVAALLTPAVAADHKPALLLAEKYHEGLDLADYWVSEKLDGVRAFWDGERLISRGGNAFAAPSWFTAGLPAVPLDGELWVGRGQFEETASIVTRHVPHDGWRRVRYMVFDLPADPGTFDERLQNLHAAIAASPNKFLAVIPQYKLTDHNVLMDKLDTVVADGGEGLMLHRGDSRYRSGRSMDLLKLKKFDDAEGIVIAHNPGQGRLAGLMGSVTVLTEQGVTVKIGSGFSDEERKNPPPIGSSITFRHQGFTASGKPRFAVFWRIPGGEPPGDK